MCRGISATANYGKIWKLKKNETRDTAENLPVCWVKFLILLALLVINENVKVAWLSEIMIKR